MQLSNLIKQVNGLIDHREQKEQQIAHGNHEKDRIKSVKKQALFKNKSKTVNPDSNSLLIGPGRVDEDEEGEASQNASARQRQENNELLAINAGY